MVPVSLMQRLPRLPRRYLKRLAEQPRLLQVHPHLHFPPTLPLTPCPLLMLLLCAGVFLLQRLPPSISRQVWDFAPLSASSAIDSVVESLVQERHAVQCRRLRCALPFEGKEGEELSLTSVEAVDLSPLLTLIGSSFPLLVLCVHRLQSLFSDTGDRCLAQLAMEVGAAWSERWNSQEGRGTASSNGGETEVQHSTTAVRATHLLIR